MVLFARAKALHNILMMTGPPVELVPLSIRRLHLYKREIPEIVRGLKLRLEQLLERREENERAEIAFRALQRLTRDKPGRPKYSKFSWETLDYYLEYHREEL